MLLGSLSVLFLTSAVPLICSTAALIVACLRFIHCPYFSSTCCGVQPFFGRIIRRVPVLYSRRGCLALRYSTVYCGVSGIGFHAVKDFRVKCVHFCYC